MTPADQEPRRQQRLTPHAPTPISNYPDRLLDELGRISHPHHVVPAEVNYSDLPAAPSRGRRGEGVEGPYQSLLAQADSLMHVIRAFPDPAVYHSEGGIDYERDIAFLNLELALSDLSIVERREERLKAALKGARAPERQSRGQEQELLVRVKGILEGERPLREEQFSDDERRLLLNYQFLTAKPETWRRNLRSAMVAPTSGWWLCAVSWRWSWAQLEEEEAAEFRLSLSLTNRP